MNPFLVFIGLSAMTYLFARDALRGEMTFTHNVLPLLILVTVVVFRKPITEKIKTLTEKINAKVEAMEREEQHLRKEKPTHDETPRSPRKIPPDDIVTAPLIEQEIYLLERFTSPERFKRMKDAYQACVRAGWAALDEYMRHLPCDYRARPLNRQPDIVWGERVLLNLTQTADALDANYEEILSGDMTGLHAGGAISNNFSFVWRDYDNEWMPEPYKSEFEKGEDMSGAIAGPMHITVNGWWLVGGLSKNYNEEHFGPLDPPKTWPIYRLNPEVQVNTGEKVPRSGVYLPHVDDSHPQFMIAGEPASTANVGRDERGQQCRERVAAVWTLVERVADEGGPVPGQEPWREENAPPPTRVEGGQPCPRKGYWCSPADKSKPRIFKKGKIMPIITSTDQAQNYWLWAGEIDEKK